MFNLGLVNFGKKLFQRHKNSLETDFHKIYSEREREGNNNIILDIIIVYSKNKIYKKIKNKSISFLTHFHSSPLESERTIKKKNPENNKIIANPGNKKDVFAEQTQRNGYDEAVITRSYVLISISLMSVFSNFRKR